MDKDIHIIKNLRNNGRQSFVDISKKTNIPVSTVYDRLTKTNLIDKYTCLLNFENLGFSINIFTLLKTIPNQKEKLGEFLTTHPSTNNVLLLNQDFDYASELIFKNTKDMFNFFDELESKFVIEKKDIHHILEDKKREGFLS